MFASASHRGRKPSSPDLEIRRKLVRSIRSCRGRTTVFECDRAIFESYCDPVPSFKLTRLYIHGSPHLDSNSASLRSISSFVRIFFSIRIASMLAIQRS